MLSYQCPTRNPYAQWWASPLPGRPAQGRPAAASKMQLRSPSRGGCGALARRQRAGPQQHTCRPAPAGAGRTSTPATGSPPAPRPTARTPAPSTSRTTTTLGPPRSRRPPTRASTSTRVSRPPPTAQLRPSPLASPPLPEKQRRPCSPVESTTATAPACRRHSQLPVFLLLRQLCAALHLPDGHGLAAVLPAAAAAAAARSPVAALAPDGASL
jgi:hypothetical protein